MLGGKGRGSGRVLAGLWVGLGWGLVCVCVRVCVDVLWTGEVAMKVCFEMCVSAVDVFLLGGY